MTLGGETLINFGALWLLPEELPLRSLPRAEPLLPEPPNALIPPFGVPGPAGPIGVAPTSE